MLWFEYKMAKKAHVLKAESPTSDVTEWIIRMLTSSMDELIT
jgi:hypothetical protein